MFTTSKKKTSKKSAACMFCEFFPTLMMALATICTLASLAGLYQAHVLSEGLAFGTSFGSMSIIALVLSLFLLKKTCDGYMCACAVTKR